MYYVRTVSDAIGRHIENKHSRQSSRLLSIHPSAVERCIQQYYIVRRYKLLLITIIGVRRSYPTENK